MTEARTPARAFSFSARAVIGVAALAILAGGCFLYPSLGDFVGDASPTVPTTKPAAGDGGGDDGAAAIATCVGADVAIDPHNCGTCGHDCEGGECEAGVCQAFDFLPVAGPVDLTTDDRGVYVTSRSSSATSAVLFMPHAGGADLAMVASGSPLVQNPSGIVVAKGRVFWTNEGANGTGSIASANVDGSDGRVIVTNLNAPSALATNGDDLVFGTRGSCSATSISPASSSACPASDGAIYVCALPECSAPRMLAANERGPKRIAASASTVFWAVEPNPTTFDAPLRRAPIAGGSGGVAIDVPSALAVFSVALDAADNAYVTASDVNAGVQRVAIGGGAGESVLPITLSGPRAIVADERDVFWLDFAFDETKGGLFRASVATFSAHGAAAPTRLSIGKASDAIAMSASSVYFTWIKPDGSGVVRKVAR